jgi:flagellin
MPLRLNNNLPALNARRILSVTGKDLAMRIERLSSGLRVNRAADDAAGLSISEGIRAEVSGFSQGIKNAEHATNLIQTAEGALGEMSGMLLRMRELAVQSASSTVNDDNRTSVNAEFGQLVNEIDRIARVTSYNNSSLLSGFGNTVSQDVTVSTALASPTTGVVGVEISGATAGTYVFADATADNQITLGNGVTTQTISTSIIMEQDGAGGTVTTGSSVIANFDRLGVQLTLSGQKAAIGSNPATDGYRDGDLNGLFIQVDAGTGGTFQIGPDDGANNRLEVNLGDMSATGTTLNLGSVSLSTLGSSQSAITSINNALNQVNKARGNLGAVQNRLAFGMRTTAVMRENDQASESSIRDADIAAEVSAFSRAQILQQSGISVFAQANIQPASALNLI